MTGGPERFLARYAEAFNDFLRSDVFPYIRERSVAEVADPVIYSYDAPGKRLRPALCLWAAGIVLPPASPTHTRAAFFAAAAVEAIHTYSLIHDDLPAMDDDDLRRGRPACHKQFSEWAAILAGDALNSFAFELVGLAGAEAEDPAVTGRLLSALSDGAARMVDGQALDLAREKTGSVQGIADDAELLSRIHTNKTAALIRASIELGVILSGVAADSTTCARWEEYGAKLGLLFQISDDLLDVHGDAAVMGKAAGKDAGRGKLTYPSVFGAEVAAQVAEKLRGDVVQLAEQLGKDGAPADRELQTAFRELPDFVLKRGR